MLLVTVGVSYNLRFAWGQCDFSLLWRLSRLGRLVAQTEEGGGSVLLFFVSDVTIMWEGEEGVDGWCC